MSALGQARLAPGIVHDRVLVLDGAMGTELQARGFALSLPLWSAGPLLEAPEVVTSLHRAYIEAGADVLTVNTFRTNPRTFRRLGQGDVAAREATFAAVGCARAAFAASLTRRVLLAGSMAPVEDCYRPDLVPSDTELLEEHQLFAGWLADAGVDVVLVETMNTLREAIFAVDAAVRTGLHVWASFVTGSDPSRLLSGERLVEAAEAAVAHGALAVGVNCVRPGPLTASLALVAERVDVALIAYANGGHTAADGVGWQPEEELDAEDYARHALEWVDLGARIVGGCCGTGPTVTSALRRNVDKLAAATYDPG